MKNSLGHQRQIEQLRTALTEKRLAHAYLFSGTEGVGKKRVALGLAQALNCVGSNPPCNSCASCNKIEKNIHPDLHLIEPDGQTIKVEVVRNLKQKIYLHPLEGKAKVVIIDKAEMMTEASANALLKILEEPPSQTHFILISARPSKILPTIRSRCQHLEFGPLTNAQIEQLLVQTGLTEEEAKEKAKFSEGGLKTALQFDPALLEEVSHQIETLRSKPSPSKILNLGELWSEDADKIGSILTCLSHLWHQKMIQAEDKTALQKAEQWMAINNAWQRLEAYANKQLLLENLLFTLTAA